MKNEKYFSGGRGVVWPGSQSPSTSVIRMQQVFGLFQKMCLCVWVCAGGEKK